MIPHWWIRVLQDRAKQTLTSIHDFGYAYVELGKSKKETETPQPGHAFKIEFGNCPPEVANRLIGMVASRCKQLPDHIMILRAQGGTHRGVVGIVSPDQTVTLETLRVFISELVSEVQDIAQMAAVRSRLPEPFVFGVISQSPESGISIWKLSHKPGKGSSHLIPEATKAEGLTQISWATAEIHKNPGLLKQWGTHLISVDALHEDVSRPIPPKRYPTNCPC